MEFCEAGKNWYEIECVVGNRHGLHARPSMDIVTASEEYNGNVNIIYDGKIFDAKSILQLMGAQILFDYKIRIRVEKGEGHEELASELARILNKNY